MIPPCIFCDNQSGSEEHLWAAWIHRLVKFGPIRVQEGTGPQTISDDPERTINTVCHKCNNTWMSRLEEKNKPSLHPMIQNQPTTIDPGRQRLLTEWAVKTAMVQDSIKPRIGNESFYTREERTNMRLNQRVPDNTRIWIGALTESHLGAFGTDFTILAGGCKTRVGTGISNTIVIGHFVVQVVTTRILPEYAHLDFPELQSKPGHWDDMLINLYPKKAKRIEWPPKVVFTNGGPRGSAYLMDRWRMGEQASMITRDSVVPLSEFAGSKPKESFGGADELARENIPKEHYPGNS
jgi:hypothetical protein